MDTTNTLARLGLLMSLAASLAMAGCGGDESTAPAPTAAPTPTPAPTPAPTPDTAYATPVDASDTAEGGSVISYAYAATTSDLTVGAVTYAAGAETFATTLAHDQGAQGFAGAALRLYAPGNLSGGTAAPLDASGFSKLRMHLASTTDGTLTIKLQPSPIAPDGCVPTAQALVSAALSEFVIDLNDATFAVPSYCAPSSATLHQRLAGLYAIDVINDAAGAGSHDVVVGSISLVP